MSDEKLSYLIDAYSDSVLRLSFSYLKNFHDAQDVCQTVFLKLYYIDKEFVDIEYEKAFILHITANVCKNILKSSWKKQRVDFEKVSEMGITQIEEDSIWNVVNELDEKYGTILYLHYYDGYKIDEISRILGMKSSTIKTRLARGREQLKKLLGGNDGK
ncbi:MAG: RNA polymerase sigma factor [Eubacteriales bacterium]